MVLKFPEGTELNHFIGSCKSLYSRVTLVPFDVYALAYWLHELDCNMTFFSSKTPFLTINLNILNHDQFSCLKHLFPQLPVTKYISPISPPALFIFVYLYIFWDIWYSGRRREISGMFMSSGTMLDTSNFVFSYTKFPHFVYFLGYFEFIYFFIPYLSSESRVKELWFSQLQLSLALCRLDPDSSYPSTIFKSRCRLFAGFGLSHK